MRTDKIAESIASSEDVKIRKKFCGIGMYIQTVIILKIKYVSALFFIVIFLFLFGIARKTDACVIINWAQCVPSCAYNSNRSSQ